MIPVSPAPEPPDFHARVREPGNNFRQKHPDSTLPPYWKEALEDMHTAYGNLCAYTAFRLDAPGTIDHFHPKSQYPHLAYEWDNYRLCQAYINSCKRDHEDVLDPFRLPPQAYFINFADGAIRVNHAAFSSTAESKLAESTIIRLKLNSKLLCNSRRSIFLLYLKGEAKGRELAPFVYDEMLRQHLLPQE